MQNDPDEQVRAAHARWQELNQKLRHTEALLSAALGLYSAGKGPLPEALMTETRALRADCNERFKALMAAMEARRPG